MNRHNNGSRSTGDPVLSRVPVTVFLFLGVTRQDAYKVGMVGCGLQLADSGEFDWAETTISVNLTNDEVRVFLRTKHIPFTVSPVSSSTLRVGILDFKEYIERHSMIVDFLSTFRRNRYLRLGSRAFLDPCDLDSRDSFILGLSDKEFDASFVSDPRGPLSFSEISSRSGRHSPVQYRPIRGLPDPGQGSWM